MEYFRLNGQWDIFEDWKRRIAKIYPVYDFSDYNTITKDMFWRGRKYYWEHSHHKQIVGNWIIDTLIEYEKSDKPADFGKIVNKNNIEKHLQIIRDQRALWIKEKPEEYNAFMTYIEDNIKLTKR